MSSHFNIWLSQQLGAGLIDIKLSVRPVKGASVAAVESEVLAAEAALATSYTRKAPRATSALPVRVAAFVSQH